MPAYMTDEELLDVMVEYDLPELPDETDENDESIDSVELILFRSHDVNLHLAYVTRTEGMEYANADEAHGEGWFVGFMGVW